MSIEDVQILWEKLISFDERKRADVLTHLFGQYQAPIEHDLKGKKESERFFNALEKSISYITK
ncbi:hypothetical protein ABEW34_21485 [Paenibacillus algorifonticola]|uniref:hypothetical protein n=1 Tax=Paenibacillus algorifonticola TaxID=684063 RepID=UPI003D2D00FE